MLQDLNWNFVGMLLFDIFLVVSLSQKINKSEHAI